MGMDCEFFGFFLFYVLGFGSFGDWNVGCGGRKCQWRGRGIRTV